MLKKLRLCLELAHCAVLRANYYNRRAAEIAANYYNRRAAEIIAGRR